MKRRQDNVDSSHKDEENGFQMTARVATMTIDCRSPALLLGSPAYAGGEKADER